MTVWKPLSIWLNRLLGMRARWPHEFVSERIESHSFANRHSFRPFVSRAQTVFNARNEPRGLAVILNCHPSRFFEVRGFGPMFPLFAWPVVGFGESIRAATDDVRALAAPRCFVSVAHSKPANDYKAVSEDDQRKIGKFELTARDFKNIVLQFIIGVGIALLGFRRLLRDDMSVFFGPVIAWCGIAISLSGPFVSLWWAK